LRIYTGASGEFSIYEDDGKSLDYQAGAGSWIRIVWDDTARTLVLALSSRTTTSTRTERTFRLEFLPEGKVQEVQYRGQPLKLQF
jgi:hypothetical protein